MFSAEADDSLDSIIELPGYLINQQLKFFPRYKDSFYKYCHYSGDRLGAGHDSRLASLVALNITLINDRYYDTYVEAHYVVLC